ncbi:MAG: cytochrome c3 family protein, partial [Thermodesulfobacteriota bacterium]|nr:cytochrome c3 family protein [Thermodesulfobacteriota bacterium]
MKRKRFYRILLIVIAGCMFTFPAREGISQGKKGSSAHACFKCHPEIQKDIFSQIAHLPAEEGKCVECHNPHTSDNEKLLIATSSNLCYQCHKKKKTQFSKSYTHLPVEKGECHKCHEPHSSQNMNLLTENQKEICSPCHTKEKIFSRKNIHVPLEKGDCLKCHNPHASDYEFLLVKDSKDICSSCHSVKNEKLAKTHNNYTLEGANCLGCHNPHSSNRENLVREFSHEPFALKSCDDCHVSTKEKSPQIMKKKGRDICIECHEEVNEQFQKIFSHLQGNSDNTCLECHNPHASDEEGLKRARDDKMCYSCHTDTKKRIVGSNVMYKYKHPEIEACTSCHLP